MKVSIPASAGMLFLSGYAFQPNAGSIIGMVSLLSEACNEKSKNS
jgi:hypothetical protein